MTQSRPRTVRYCIRSDAFGPFVTFEVDDVVLPEGALPANFPEGAQLEWVKLECRFMPNTPNMGAHGLRQLFMEFAEAMDWQAVLDT
jgi:hypothetical protein